VEYIVVGIVALVASGLTLFSGFGLATILTPVFVLFFPVPVAVAATAVVHLLNNLFKVVLVGRQADWRAVVRFSVPAVFAAVVGALLLNFVAALPDIGAYRLAGTAHSITVVKLVIGLLIVGFSLLELVPRFRSTAVDPKYLPLGGLLSGFFGGLSGNQGAFRSMFLIRAGLTKDAFIGTNVVTAVIVDVARLLVYGGGFYRSNFSVLASTAGIVVVATLAAFAGALIGKELSAKVTYRSLQFLVGVMLMVLGLGLVAGLI
jgi:uncharacterized membrane protein YfcA